MKFFKHGTVKPNPDTRHEYAPFIGQVSYIWKLPDQHHGLFLVENETAIYEWTCANGTTKKVWCLEERNSGTADLALCSSSIFCRK